MKRTALLALFALSLPFANAAAQVAVQSGVNVPAPVVPVAALQALRPLGIDSLPASLSGASLAPLSPLPSVQAGAAALALPAVIAPLKAGAVRALAPARFTAVLRAPAAQADASAGSGVAAGAAEVRKSLDSPGWSKDAPAEASKGAAEELFAALRGERLIAPAGKEALLDEARAAVSGLFRNPAYLTRTGGDAQARLGDVMRRAQALRGRSVVYLEAPTAAGKSTLAANLQKVLGDRIKVFPVDRYFKSAREVKIGPDGKPDFDRPDSLHLERAASDIRALLSGSRVELPDHDMKTSTFYEHSGDFLQLGKDDVLIVDSVFASDRALLRAGAAHQSLNVFLYAPAALRLARRLKRDTVERGMPPEANLRHWPVVLADEKEFILPLRRTADVVLNLTGETELEGLPDAFAALLASQWAARGRDPALTELFLSRIEASLEADARP